VTDQPARGRAGSRLLPFSLAIGVAALTIVLLIEGRELLVPVALAIVIWYLINALARGLGRLAPGDHEPPRWLRLAAAVAVMGLAFWLIGRLIGGSLAQVSEAAPGYQENLDRLIRQGAAMVGFAEIPTMAEMFNELDLRALISDFAESAANIAGRIGIIIVYVIFLLFEQTSFDRKLGALFPNKEREDSVRRIIGQVQADVQTYVWIKTLMSILTGFVSWVVLVLVGVDFAAFWAFVIFLLNYIPTIGSLMGVVFPAILTLIQFSTLGPFLIVTLALGGTQFAIGNLLEPRLMGSSLNLSPLVVILSLALWGQIWGLVGMFLCVPIMVILMIVFAHFKPTRPIAIMLSSNGRVDDYVTK